jgi:hypothetical protein
MDSSPCLKQQVPPGTDQAQHTPRFALIAADDLAHFQPNQIDHHDPPGADHMDVRGRVIVGVNNDPESFDY